MKNETAISTRKSAKTQPETGQAVPAVRRPRQKYRPARRRPGHQAGRPAPRADSTIADGFLRHRFLPLFEERFDRPQDNGIGQGVFDSLSRLSRHFYFRPPDVSAKPYPYNIMLAHWDAQKQIRRQRQDIELFIVCDQNDRISMATKETARRDYSLYYIPVLPLYRLSHLPEYRAGADLLLSVFAWLYHVAGVPYYRQEGTFLYYHYEMIADWLADDFNEFEDDEKQCLENGLRSALHCGDIIERKIFNPVQLQRFPDKIAKAKCRNPTDEACLKIARAAFALWQEFPGRTIFTNLEPTQDDDDGYGNIAYLAEYLSFVADTDGRLYDHIQMNIDAELNEKQYWQEHTLVTVFDENFSANSKTLEFENRFFALLNDLCQLLNQIP